MTAPSQSRTSSKVTFRYRYGVASSLRRRKSASNQRKACPDSRTGLSLAFLALFASLPHRPPKHRRARRRV